MRTASPHSDRLDERLKRLVRFVVDRDGRFYNDELAADLGIDDRAQTFSPLGQLTAEKCDVEK